MEESQQLLNWFRGHDAAVVAFSGGLDSSVVAKAAALALGEGARAVMAVSPTCFEAEPDEARSVAEAVGIHFVRLESSEMNDEAFTANDPDRCYYCKRIRFREICRYAEEQGIELVLDGSNADDRNDYRPGSRAVRELDIRSPLQELDFGKQTVRELARLWQLPNSERPASPCLATRIAYGLEITEDRLRQIERGERFLASLGFSPIRVRLHPDALARIEVPPEQLDRLCEAGVRKKIVAEFRAIGFRYISAELQGFRSGSMNPEGS